MWGRERKPCTILWFSGRNVVTVTGSSMNTFVLHELPISGNVYIYIYPVPVHTHEVAMCYIYHLVMWYIYIVLGQLLFLALFYNECFFMLLNSVCLPSTNDTASEASCNSRPLWWSLCVHSLLSGSRVKLLNAVGLILVMQRLSCEGDHCYYSEPYMCYYMYVLSNFHFLC